MLGFSHFVFWYSCFALEVPHNVLLAQLAAAKFHVPHYKNPVFFSLTDSSASALCLLALHRGFFLQPS